MAGGVGLRSGSRAKLCLVSAVAGCLGLSLLAVGWVAHVAAQGMALPGKFDVTPTGAATYTIPIAVPPGTAGMVPSLSIAHNSQGRNGLLGMGWHLEGLPSIGRCPRTVAQDGVRGSVNYDANDRFCLDGQRLVAISGTYGADGTEYRTEIESFSKVVSHGTAGTGPAWFEVWTKSGQRMEFGNTTDSRVLAQGKTTARDWVVNKVSDTAGNYFTVTYVNDTANGQVYPDRIDYTGNAGAGLAPYNSVRFVYNPARPDIIQGYHAGSLQKTTVLLTNVQTYAGSSIVADYRLAYEQSPTTGRSRLISLTLCEGGGSCLPATTFGWQSGTMSPSIISNVAGQDGKLSEFVPYIGDFNGDGLSDILWNLAEEGNPEASRGTRVLWTGKGDGDFNIASNFAGQNGTLVSTSSVKQIPYIGDFNRDGRADILWLAINPESESVPSTKWSSTAFGVYEVGPGPTLENSPDGINSRVLADVNGDGRADLMNHVSIFLLFNVINTYILNADGSVSKTQKIAPNLGANFFSVFNYVKGLGTDFNGDGLADLYWLSGLDDVVSLGKGDGTYVDITTKLQSPFLPRFGDFNGDGKTDVLGDEQDDSKRSEGHRDLLLSKGDGTFVFTHNLGGQDGTLSGYRPYVADFNADGLTDILWDSEEENAARSTGSRVLWLSRSDGSVTVITNFAGQNGNLVGYTPVIADFNGDGKADILWDSRSGIDARSTGTRVMWLSDGVAPDLMTSVTTGLGAKITVTYKSTTDGTVYAKDGTAADPIVDVQGPMQVVSRVDVVNGIGGVLSKAYAYAGAKVHLDGRGFLGFREVRITDLQTNIVQTTNYLQEFPYTFLVASERTLRNGATLNRVTHKYASAPLGGTRHQVSLEQSEAISFDLDGSAMPGVTTSYQYDDYGNATEIVVATTDGHGKTTSNIYANDTAKWHLGRLTRASVASLITEPGPPPSAPPIEATISSSVDNLNLWDHLVATGLATPGTIGSWHVTIAGGVVIGSTSTSLPALDTGTFPAGSTLTITNNGTIAGAGGSGGKGASCLTSTPTAAMSGVAGGSAFRAQVPVTVVNNGAIWGGGGGGGGGGGSFVFFFPLDGGGGGGGAGSAPGNGGAPGGSSALAGGPGSLSAGGSAGSSAGGSPGGRGGNPGEAGQTGTTGTLCQPTPGSGGPPGAAVDGNSFITWVAEGDRRGPLN